MMRYAGAAVIIILAVIMLFPLLKRAGHTLLGYFKESDAALNPPTVLDPPTQEPENPPTEELEK